MPLAKTPSWGYICPRIHCWPPCTCSGLGRDTAAWAETADERWDWNILMSVLHTRKLRIRVTWFNKSNRARNRTSVCFATAKSLQSCLTLCDPIDSSPPGSPVPGILQARTLEWVAISFSNAWKWKVKVKSLSRVQLLATPWTAALQAPPSMGFSRQEYWSGMLLPSPS